MSQYVLWMICGQYHLSVQLSYEQAVQHVSLVFSTASPPGAGTGIARMLLRVTPVHLPPSCAGRPGSKSGEWGIVSAPHRVRLKDWSHVDKNPREPSLFFHHCFPFFKGRFYAKLETAHFCCTWTWIEGNLKKRKRICVEELPY